MRHRGDIGSWCVAVSCEECKVYFEELVIQSVFSIGLVGDWSDFGELRFASCKDLVVKVIMD